MGIFGENYKDIWEHFANENNYNFEKGTLFHLTEITDSKSPWKSIIAPYIVSTGKSSTYYTAVYSYFRLIRPLNFKILHGTFLSRLWEMFGTEYIKTGYEDFDNEYRVKCKNDVETVKQLLRHNEQLRSNLIIMGNCRLYFDWSHMFSHFSPENGQNCLFLYFYGLTKDFEMLKLLFQTTNIILQFLYEKGYIEKI